MPLSLAAANGNAVMIERLLSAGADPNAALPEGETPLMAAAGTGNVAAVKTLLAHGADVNARDRARRDRRRSCGRPRTDTRTPSRC